jgi:hypothetical protein
MADTGGNKSKKVLRAAIPPYIREVFGRPPLLRTEDPDAYDRLLSELALEISPRGIAEWLWVRELADLNWEILRTRRAIASLLNISFKPALFETLIRVLPSSERSNANEIAEQWFARPEGDAWMLARIKVIEILEKYGLERIQWSDKRLRFAAWSLRKWSACSRLPNVDGAPSCVSWSCTGRSRWQTSRARRLSTLSQRNSSRPSESPEPEC